MSVPTPTALAEKFERALTDFLSRYVEASEIVYGQARRGSGELAGADEKGPVSDPGNVQGGEVSDPTGNRVACGCDLNNGPHRCKMNELRWAGTHAQRALNSLEKANAALDQLFDLADGPPPLRLWNPHVISPEEKAEQIERQRRRQQKLVIEVRW